MRIQSLTLENFQCYAGEHHLELEAKPYAIVARHDDDAERSNWLGKTTLLEAVRFALTGEHCHRTEDGWITRGEKHGRVCLVLSNGVIVERARKVGKSTKLEVSGLGPGASETAYQEEGEAALARVLGLTPDDFRATCYFEQRQMARLILAEPRDRMAMVSSWLRLGKLEEAEQVARSKGTVLAARLEELATKRGVWSGNEADVLRGHGVESREALEYRRGEVREEVARAAAALRAVEEVWSRNEAAHAARGVVAQYQELIAEGRAAKERASALDLSKLEEAAKLARARLQDEVALLRSVSADEQAKRRLALGQFDGRCPVAEIACPAKDSINQARARNAKLADEAGERLAAVRRGLTTAEEEERHHEAQAQGARRAHDRLADLRAREAKMRLQVEVARALAVKAEPREELERRLDEARTAVRKAQAEQGRLEHDLRLIDASREKLAEVSAEAERVSKELGTVREAATLLGKNGAQRRVAEEALVEIEQLANTMLRESGIDLSVEVRWAREGQGLAKACDQCGSPFPASATVKVCGRCKAARGPLLVNKLTVELSNRSGAAEDLGGAALQLAASAWLRGERGAAWATALVDEPFGMLDAANRRAFAAGLVRMMGECGFEQSLVIAHHASVLDALPGRIEVRSNGEHARVAVVV